MGALGCADGGWTGLTGPRTGIVGAGVGVGKGVCTGGRVGAGKLRIGGGCDGIDGTEDVVELLLVLLLIVVTMGGKGISGPG